LKKYYLQIYQGPGESASECDRILIEELPYQTLIIERLSALGVIDIEEGMLSVDQIDRIAKILRLRHSLGVNLSGAAIICELMDRLDEMEKEIERQRRK